MNESEAKESVDALLEDLRHIMSVRPHTLWPEMAQAAREHHEPMIDDRLLPWAYRRLQRAGHLTLAGLVDSDAERIRTGILDIRTMEKVDSSPPPALPERPGRQTSTIDLREPASSPDSPRAMKPPRFKS